MMQSAPPPPPPGYRAPLERIAEALERIAVALEGRQAPPPEEEPEPEIPQRPRYLGDPDPAA